MKNQVRHLVRRFTMRTGKMRSRLELPPTPSSSSIASLGKSQQVQSKGASIQSPSRSQPFEPFKADEQRPKLENPFVCAMLCGGKGSGGNKHGVLDPQGSFYISWLCIVSMTFLYNAWVIPLRSSFPFQTPENTNTWLVVDFCADVIYLLDVIFIKHRIMYLYGGFWVRDKDLTRKNYMRKLKFKVSHRVYRMIPNFNLMLPHFWAVGYFVADSTGFVVLEARHECCVLAGATFAENSKFLGSVSAIGSRYCIAISGN